MNLHDTLIKAGFKVTAAPDEATIYTNSEGTTVTVEEPKIKCAVKNCTATADETKIAEIRGTKQPVCGRCFEEIDALKLAKTTRS